MTVLLVKPNLYHNTSKPLTKLSPIQTGLSVVPLHKLSSYIATDEVTRRLDALEHDLYKTFVHRNTLTDHPYEYRLTLTAEEQLELIKTNLSRMFVPLRKDMPKTEKEIAHFEQLDLFNLKPPEFLKNFKNPCWYDENKLLRCLPYFYLIGAPKCGTTDIHKKVTFEITVAKELVIFSGVPRTLVPTVLSGEDLVRNLSEFRFTDYLVHFSKLSELLNNAMLSKDQMKQLITGDCSASTMWDNTEWINLPRNYHPLEPQYTNADYIYHLNPSTKIIFILRNPINRLYSDYLFFENTFKKSPANFHRKVVDSLLIFTACLQATSLRSCVYNNHLVNLLEVRLHIGIYYIYLTEWYSKFSRKQILPLNLEEYSRSPNDSLVKIFEFLEMRLPTESRLNKMLNLGRANTRSLRNINVGPMWLETRQILYKFYKPFNRMLAWLLQDITFDYGFT